jgi:hypothetical protein
VLSCLRQSLFGSAWQLGGAYMRCGLKVVLDAVKKTELPGFTYDYESRIAEIKREYDAGHLPAAANLIEDLHKKVGAQFPPP